jgi:glyoxylase-like metal-dependent hydrolase (beta-lactamase superfamily II)
MNWIWFTTMALLSCARLGAQEGEWDEVRFEVQKVAGTVYMLSGVGEAAGGNIGVSVGEDGILLVDDLFAPRVPKIEAALATISAKPVRFVVNTHYHGDHVNGNKVFGSKSTIVAHDNARQRILEDDAFDMKRGTHAPQQALPILTFDSRISFHFNGEEIRGIHVPSGHTDGDTVVHFTGSNVIHMGDDFFNGTFPFIDLEAGGSAKGYVAAVKKALAEAPADARFIPGHGPLATRADLAAHLAMMEATLAVVERGIAGGKTLEELKAAKIMDPWAKNAKWFITPEYHLTQLYNSLKGIPKNPS